MNPPPIPPGEPSDLPGTGSGEPADAVPAPAPAPRRSRLAVVAFVLAAIAVPAALVAASALFGAVWNMPGPEAQAWILTLLVSTILGFLASLLGSIPMVRMRGRRPELAGRGLALFAVAGPRAVLFGSGLVFGSIWVARQIAGEPDILRDDGRTIHLLWAVAAALVAGYVAASVRRARSELRSRTRGWLLYAGGLMTHLGLIVGFPFCLVGAFLALHQEQMTVGQDRNMPQEPVYVGAYAHRELWIDQPAQTRARATFRHWRAGRPSDLGTLELSGTNRVRWTLAESGPGGSHHIEWRLTSGGEGGGKGTFEVPGETTLVPMDSRNALAVVPGSPTNLWLFLPLGSGGPGAEREKEGIELVVEPAGRR